jgi:hypothetical protein
MSGISIFLSCHGLSNDTLLETEVSAMVSFLRKESAALRTSLHFQEVVPFALAGTVRSRWCIYARMKRQQSGGESDTKVTCLSPSHILFMALMVAVWRRERHQSYLFVPLSHSLLRGSSACGSVEERATPNSLLLSYSRHASGRSSVEERADAEDKLHFLCLPLPCLWLKQCGGESDTGVSIHLPLVNSTL